MKKIMFFGLPVIALALGLILAGCGGSSIDGGEEALPPPDYYDRPSTGGGKGGGGGLGFGGGSQGQQVTATAAEFEEKITSLITTSGNHTITITESISDFAGISLDTAGVSITLKGNASQPLEITSTGSTLFTVTAGKLTLENITLGRAAAIGKNAVALNNNVNSNDLLIAEGNGTIELKDGVKISNTDGTDYSDGISVGDNGTFIISGGTTIEKCFQGVRLYGSGAKATISAGTIKDCAYTGVSVEGTGATVTISGGTFSNNGDHGVRLIGSENTVTMSNNVVIKDNPDGHGVAIGGSKNTFNMSGGKIENCLIGVGADEDVDTAITISGGEINNPQSGNQTFGIQIYEDSENATMVISGGTISGSVYDGIHIAGTGAKVTISGGTIKGSGNQEVLILGTDNTVTMSGGLLDVKTQGIGCAEPGSDNSFIMTGGSIVGGERGIQLGGKNNSFDIKAEGVIENTTDEAILIYFGNANDRRVVTLVAGNQYAAKTNEDGDDIIAGSLKGTGWTQ